ncbi:MAG: hypothetical protein CFE45_19105, partial [Burkholderiales bacterium PBB5]
MTPAVATDPHAPDWRRRARPLLGTLVEIGLAIDTPEAAADAGFAAVLAVQQALSRFDEASDLGRFHALAAGGVLQPRPLTRRLLRAAAALQAASAGLFDISLGTGPAGWRLDGAGLHRLQARTRL